MILWFILACAPKVAPIGPHGLACEGRTAVFVDPEPWSEVRRIRVEGQHRRTPEGPVAVLPTRDLLGEIELQLDGARCSFRPASTAAEAGTCGGIGVALHYLPLCELGVQREVLASSEMLLLDTRETCLLDTRAYREFTGDEPHQTCGGRPPGDRLEGVIEAAPTQAAFPWLAP